MLKVTDFIWLFWPLPHQRNENKTENSVKQLNVRGEQF